MMDGTDSITPQVSNEFFDKAFANVPALAILRGMTPSATIETATNAWSLEIDLVEVPIMEAHDEAVFRDCLAAKPSQKFLGVGTCRTEADITRAYKLGSDFTVSPAFDREVALKSLQLGMPHFPGVGSARDVHDALIIGLQWLKVFPASAIDLSFYRAIKAPMPDAKLVSVGGVTPSNAEAFRSAGADGVAFGSQLRSVSPAELSLVINQLKKPTRGSS